MAVKGAAPLQTSAVRWALMGLSFFGFTAVGLYLIYAKAAQRRLAFDDRLFAPDVLIHVGALLLVYFCADGMRLYLTLRALGYRVPAAAMARLVFLNLFVSNITPMATGGGVAQVWYLSRYGVPPGVATAATTIRTVLAIAVIFAAAPVCVWVLSPLRQLSVVAQVASGLIVVTPLYLGFFAIALLRTRWLVPPVSGLITWLHRCRLIRARRHRRWQYRFRRELLRFVAGLRRYVQGRRRFVIGSMGATLVFLAALFTFPAVLISGLGYGVHYGETLGRVVLTTFLMYFAPTPGASGISEGAFGLFFRQLLTPEHLILVTIAWRFLTIYLGMLIGLIQLQRELAAAVRGR